MLLDHYLEHLLRRQLLKGSLSLDLMQRKPRADIDPFTINRSGRAARSSACSKMSSKLAS